MGAPVAWFEITSHDPARLVTFYRELFDWSIADGPASGYSLVDTGAEGEAIGGGIGTTEGPDKPLVPPTDLPDGYGRFAMFADPAGHTVGLWS